MGALKRVLNNRGLWLNAKCILLLLLLLILIGVRCARPGESENTISVQRPKPHTTNPWKEEKDEIGGDKKERADHASSKAWALLLKPASIRRSNCTNSVVRSKGMGYEKY